MKKNHRGHAVNSTEVRAMMREKCTEKEEPALNAGLIDEEKTR